MAEILFYHLTERTLEQSLPLLLEKCLERGWRAVVQAGSQERVEVLDNHLWTWREDSFLAHSAAADGTEPEQPVFLTTGTGNPNRAEVRFLVDGADLADLSPYVRACFIFDGHDAAAVEQAREQWKREKAAGNPVTYWKQREDGGWEKKA